MDVEQEEMQFLGFFGMIKESNKIIITWRKIFNQITFTLIIPLAFIFLAQIEVSDILLSKIIIARAFSYVCLHPLAPSRSRCRPKGFSDLQESLRRRRQDLPDQRDPRVLQRRIGGHRRLHLLLRHVLRHLRARKVVLSRGGRHGRRWWKRRARRGRPRRRQR